MKNVRTPWMVAVAAGTIFAGSALAQPVLDGDLGTLTAGTPAVINVPGVAANTVRWYKFTLPTAVRYQDLKSLDIWSFNAGTAQDTEVTLWDSVGNRVGTDDDDGNSLNSALSFGTGGGGFPSGTTTITANNGRDGDLLAAGDYYISVTYFNVVNGTTNWTVTTPGTTALTAFDITVSLKDITPVDPVGTVDLGTMAANDTETGSDAIAASSVRWFKVTVPAASNANGTYIDMDTEGSVVTGGATRMAVYTPSGAPAGNALFTTLQDATDGSGSLSQLSFGLVNPNRPAVGSPAGLAYNGRDGDLRPGLYYIGVAATGTSPSTTSTISGQNFGFASTSTNTGTVNLNVATGSVTTNPGGSGSVVGCILSAPSTVTLRVTATLGGNPVSTGLGVSVDGSALGVGTVTLLDDGLNGDGAAGDNVFGRSVTTATTTPGAYSLPFTVSDAQGRNGTGNIAATVRGTTGAEGLAGAIVPAGNPGDALTSISGNFELSRATIHQIQICDEATFSASVVGGTTVDTQMFLFNADGTGVAMNDDVVGGTTLQSALSSTFVNANGTYYLAIVQYDRDPVSDLCADTAMWLDTPFRAERAPDGPGAAGSIVGWSGLPVATPSSAAYVITLTGACVPGSAPACDTIDFNNNGVFPEDQDVVDFFDVLAGGTPATCDVVLGCQDIDFNNNGVFPEDQDVVDFFNVLAGGTCP